MRKRQKILLTALPIAILAILAGWYLFGQTLQAEPESTPIPQPGPLPTDTEPSDDLPTDTEPSDDLPTDTEPSDDLPDNLLVVPEVPLGSLAIVLACFFALLIATQRSKSPVRL